MSSFLLSVLLACSSRRAPLVLFALLLLCPLPSAVWAQKKDIAEVVRADAGVTKRAALVIGNAAYASKPLTNPTGEAKSVADTMKQLGYTVTLRTNLSLNQMQDTVNAWTKTLDDHTLAFVYYSGHGVCYELKNYFVPIDNSNIKFKHDVPNKAYPFQTLLDAVVERGCPLRIFILDACRNDPLPLGSKGADEQNGLVKTDGPNGTFIAYATQFGKTAIDGIYTPALLRNILIPNLPIVDLFQQVRDEVYFASNREQTTDDSNQLIGKFCFKNVVYIEGGGPNPVYKEASAQELVAQGNEAWGMEKYEEAAAYFTIAVGKDPNSAEAFCGRGAAYNELKQYDKAFSDLNIAIRLKPDFAMAYNNRGACWHFQGKHDNAVSDFSQAIRLQPDNVTYYNNRSHSYYDNRQYEQAIADCTALLKLKPDDASVYNHRGCSWHSIGKHDNAVADFTQAIRLQPSNAAYYSNRGNSYLANRQYEQALADYRHCVEIEPNAPSYVLKNIKELEHKYK